MAFSAAEQELYDWLRSSIPRWFFQKDTAAQEIFGAAVESLIEIREHVDFWIGLTYILTATDLWLNEHARDRGTFRQATEVDAVLRERLRATADAVTRPALLAEAELLLDAQPVAGTAYMVEMPREQAFFGTTADRPKVGGTFATVSGTTKKFTPSTPYAGMIEVGFDRGGWQGNPRVVFSGAASGGNNGTFTITDLDGDALVYTNAAGVNEVDASVNATLRIYDVDGNLRSGGKTRAFLSRGYRMSDSSAFVIILPYGTTEDTRLAVAEAVRKKKAGGIDGFVERRLNP